MPKCLPHRHFDQIKHVHSLSLLVYKFFGLHLISEKKHQFLAKTFFFVWSSPDLGEKTLQFPAKKFFFGLHLISGKKHFNFWRRPASVNKFH